MSGDCGEDQRKDHQPVSLNEAAHGNHECGDRGQGTIAEHVVKDCFEFWHDEHEQEPHDRAGHGHDDERINHRSGDFVSNFGRLLLELREAGENEL